ncbi:MAG: DUF1592 domain-containing protein, partial [Myxococcota bacterium]
TPTDASGPTLPSDEAEFVEFTAPGSSLARRLTHREYEWTLEDLFELELSSEELSALPVDEPLSSFARVDVNLSPSRFHVRAYSEVAEIVAERLDLSALAQQFADCDLAQNGCPSAFIENLGLRLFRRPLDVDEAQRFKSLWDAVVELEATPTESASAVLQAMLQSPQFLYLITDETQSGVHALGSYEIASRLSFFIWGAGPDERLLAEAESGAILEPDARRLSVERMFDDDTRVRRSLTRFIEDWVKLDRIPNSDGLKGDRVEGAKRFYVDALMEDRPFFDLLTDAAVYLSPELATLYGIESGEAGVQRYELDAQEPAKGLLAQPGVLAGMTNADGGSIVSRALFVVERLFCEEVPPPPDSLQDDIDEFVDNLPEDASAREIADVRLGREECAVCHTQFDPLAFALETFDASGARVDEPGQPVDGWIPAYLTDDGERQEFSDMAEFIEILADSEKVHECFVRQHIDFALGSILGTEYEGELYAFARELGRDGLSAREMFIEVATSSLFAQVRVP